MPGTKVGTGAALGGGGADGDGGVTAPRAAKPTWSVPITGALVSEKSPVPKSDSAHCLR